MMTVPGALGVFALLLVWIVAPTVQRRGDQEAEQWAADEGVRLDATTTPLVTGYLRSRRHLRQIGAVGGLLVAPSVTAGTGIDLRVPGMVWLLSGYLVGCLWAELALTRRAGVGRRSASLSPRRLREYLPAGMLGAEVVAPVLVVGLALVCQWVVTPPDNLPRSGWRVGATPEVLQRGALLAGLLAPLAAAGILAAQRHIVRRPQPLVDPAHVALDDAMRSSSVRLLGGTGLAAIGVLATTQLAYIAVTASGTASSVAGMASLLVLLVALIQWQWWPYLRWRVRRSPARPVPATSLAPATDGAPGGDRG